MKAVLVIDISEMPKNCLNCPMENSYSGTSVICKKVWTGKERPEWCPLRPLPEKLDLSKYPNGSMTKEIAEGYNICLDEILGETE